MELVERDISIKLVRMGFLLFSLLLLLLLLHLSVFARVLALSSFVDLRTISLENEPTACCVWFQSPRLYGPLLSILY